MTDIHQKTHASVDHLMAFVHKKFDEYELDVDGGHVARLTCGKAAEFTNEYCALLDETVWDELYHSWSLEPPAMLQALNRYYLLQVLNQSSGFKRRVFDPALSPRP